MMKILSKKECITTLFENFVEEQKKKDLISQIRLISELLKYNANYYDLKISIFYRNKNWYLEQFFKDYILFCNFNSYINLYYNKEDDIYIIDKDVFMDELTIEELDNIKYRLEKILKEEL